MSSEEIREKLRPVRCFLLDMDGTFYLGNNLIDGSLDFLEALRATGRTARFLTNNSSRSASVYARKLKGMGVPEEYRDVISSGHAAAHYCLRAFPQGHCFLMGNPDFRGELESLGVQCRDDDPDYVLLAFDTTLEYRRLCTACDLIRAGLPYIATHPDINCPTEYGFMPDSGAMCALITMSTGVKPRFTGKPHEEVLEILEDHTGIPRSRMAAVGDRLYTDIALGTKNNVTSILVMSGETTPEDLAASDVRPTMVVKNIGELERD